MERRPFGRDPGLSARIVTVVVLLAATVAALATGFFFAFREVPAWWPYWTGLAVVLAGGTVYQLVSAQRRLLASVGPGVVDEARASEVRAVVERLSGLADVPPPRIAVLDSAVPTVFSAGLTRAGSVLAAASAVVDTLDPLELEAVVAHELAHIINRDGAVMTAASIPRTLGSLLLGCDNGIGFYVWFFLWPIGAVLWAVSSGLTIALGRYRDFVADREAALLTGAPEQLMSALQKIRSDVDRIPDADLRQLDQLNDFLIVRVLGGSPSPRGNGHGSIVASHS